MSREESSFNEDQFNVSKIQGRVETENVSGTSDVLSENHPGRGEREGRGSPYSSTPSLGNVIDIPSPLQLQRSEDMIESVADNTQDVTVNPSNPEPCPAPITILAPPTNQLLPSLLVEPVQQERNFVSVDEANGMNFAYQDQSVLRANTFNPDNSFQVDTQIMSNQDITFSLHEPVNNGFGYVPLDIPSHNFRPELLDQSSRFQLPPYNHTSYSELAAQIGVGIENNGTNFVHGTANWANMHGNTFGSQGMQFQQDLGGGMDGQGGFYAGGSTSNQFQLPNMPYNPDENHGRNFGSNNLLEPGQSSSLMGMDLQNGMTVTQELQPSGLYDQDGNYITNVQHMRTLMRNSVYDPMYEAMGLPVDPHLRIFLSQRGHDGLENPAGKADNAGRNN